MATKVIAIGAAFAGRGAGFGASRAKRFDVLRQPFVFEWPERLTRREAEQAAHQAATTHLHAMERLLRAQAGLPLEGQLDRREAYTLLWKVLRTYVPAFGPYQIVRAKRAQGRPRTGLTDRQKAAIDHRVAAGHSVRDACVRIARGDRQKGEALAAAYRRRATKPVRRK